jgi:hypothetical protein
LCGCEASRKTRCPIAVPDENDIANVLELKGVDDVGDVHLEVGVGTHQMGTLSRAGQGRTEDIVTLRAKQTRDLVIAPATMTAAMNQDEGSHTPPRRLVVVK